MPEVPRKKKPVSKKPKQRIPARALRSNERSGGKWGDGLRDRLEALMKARSLNRYAFAAQVGMDPSRVSEWLSGKVLPKADSLRAIAEATTPPVSLDWLLLGVDGNGDLSASPVYRGVSRPAATLGEDIIAVLRMMLERAPQASDVPSWRKVAATLPIDAEEVLQDAYSKLNERMWPGIQRENNQLASIFNGPGTPTERAALITEWITRRFER